MRLTLMLLIVLGTASCGIIESRGPGLDAKGFGGDPRKTAVENAIKWIISELRRVANRNFGYVPEALEYRGRDTALMASVAELRDDATRFNATQTFLSTVMRDARLLTLAGRLEVVLESPEAVAVRAGAHDDAAIVGRKFYVTARKVDALSADPRAFLVFVAHHVLHAFGFGGDAALAVGPLPVPAALATGTNGALLTGLSLQLVMFSRDFRFPLAGDDPEPSGVQWRMSFDDDFGGPGGVAVPAAPVNAARWKVEPGASQRQVDGYLTNATASGDHFDLATQLARRDFRIALDVIRGSAPFGTHHFTVAHRSSVGTSLQPTATSIGGSFNPGNQCSATLPGTPRGELVVTFLDDLVVARWNGAVVCQFRQTPPTQGMPLLLEGQGIRIDRARVDVNAAE